MNIFLKLISLVTFLYSLSLLYVSHHFDTGLFILLFLSIVFFLLSKYYKNVFRFINERKVLKRVIISLFSISFLFIFFFEYLIWDASHDDVPKDIDYLIVLGCGLKDGEPSFALKKRLNKANRYYQEHPDVKIIVSGGIDFGEDRPEGEVMKEYLTSLNVPPESIIDENKATSTFENLAYSKKLIPDFESHHKVAIITSDFHMFRAKMIAKRLDYVPCGLPANTPSHILIQVHIREYLAIVHSYLFDK